MIQLHYNLRKLNIFFLKKKAGKKKIAEQLEKSSLLHKGSAVCLSPWIVEDSGHGWQQMVLISGFLIPFFLKGTYTIRGMGKWKGGSILVVPLLQEFSFPKKGIKYRTCHNSYYICWQLPHLLSIPSGVSQGWRTSGHNKHLHSFASDQGGFSRCRHPG